MSPSEQRNVTTGPRQALVFVALLASLVAAPPPHPSSAFLAQTRPSVPSAYSLTEAQKVLRTIDAIESATARPWAGALRQTEITENELNSYVAHRIETEDEEIMKALKLKLFADNRVEGMIHVDLRGQKAPSFLKPEMDIFFSADLIVANHAIKVEMKKLFVGKEPIQPYILDVIIGLSAALQKTEAMSLDDWYPLPYGIKDVKTHRGRAIFYY